MWLLSSNKYQLINMYDVQAITLKKYGPDIFNVLLYLKNHVIIIEEQVSEEKALKTMNKIHSKLIVEEIEDTIIL